jgi:hypothetical protein
MPYSVPAPAPQPLVVHSQGRPRHRRSWCDTRMHPPAGAFAPLPIPRRTFQSYNLDDPKLPASHDGHDSSTNSSSSSSCITTPDTDAEDGHDKPIAPFKLKTTNLFLDNFPIPFPRSSHRSPPVSPPTSTASSQTLPVYSAVACTPPNSIVPSHGKPLKSSLKSPSSSPTLSHCLPSSTSPNATANTNGHVRACSAPASPHTPKNVHFPSREQGGLETVCTFSRTAKPASLSRSRANSAHCGSTDDTETETESEGCRYLLSRGFPFSRFPRTSPGKSYELDAKTSSPVPAANLSSFANIHLESLAFSSSVARPSAVAPAPHEKGHSLALIGTILVRNLAYEKTVAVRFTLDEWNTVSEVATWHVGSLPGLPKEMFCAGSGLNSGSIFNSTSSSILEFGLGKLRHGDKEKAYKVDRESQHTKDSGWDRFGFIIRLEDYAPTLQRRTMWLAAQYVSFRPWPYLLTLDFGLQYERWHDQGRVLG